MKNGLALPGWAAGAAIAVLVLILIVIGVKIGTAGGPLPESQYPKEAYQAPGYGNPSAHAGGTAATSGTASSVSGYGGTTMTPEQAAQRGR